MSLITNLQAYRLERQNRKRIRDSYNQKLEELNKKKGSIHLNDGLEHNLVDSCLEKTQLSSAVLAEQNKQLIFQLTKLEEQERQNIGNFKQKFDEVKNLYLAKIRQISQEGKKYKEEYLSKMTNLNDQYSSAVKKTSQIQAYNQKLEADHIQATTLSQKYLGEIEQQYAAKLKEFGQVFEASSQKIKTVEEKMGYEELVEATLSNEELINEIKDSALKNADEIDRIYDDYVELLKAKQEILSELKQNNKLKEKEVGNSSILEGKLKHIVTKLGQQRQLYLDQNRKMSAELMQIQALLEKVMGAAIE